MPENASSHPLISVVTRYSGRKELLRRNRRSLQAQTDPDFEQIVITDEKNRGYHWANSQIAKLSEILKGEYIYILDDDDYLICSTFIQDFKEILDKNNDPPVVICKGYINETLFPKTWRQKPLRGCIGSPNFIVKTRLFYQFRHMWQQERAGDYFFINACWSWDKDAFFWWDKVIFTAG